MKNNIKLELFKQGYVFIEEYKNSCIFASEEIGNILYHVFDKYGNLLRDFLPSKRSAKVYITRMGKNLDNE